MPTTCCAHPGSFPEFGELMSQHVDDAIAICIPAAFFIAAVLAGRIVERIRLAEAYQPPSEIALDYRLAALNFLINAGLALAPAIFADAGGMGLIRLDAEGWRFVPSLLIYIVTLDLMLYWFHR